LIYIYTYRRQRGQRRFSKNTPERPETIFKKYAREARDDFQKIRQRGQRRFAKNTPERPEAIFKKCETKCGSQTPPNLVISL
jgi:hypothetical protein